MRAKLKAFLQSETGAVTTDFVVLTAATVGIGLAVLMVIAPGIRPNAEKVDPAANGAATLGSSLING